VNCLASMGVPECVDVEFVAGPINS
jgi:hypothetical protein